MKTYMITNLLVHAKISIRKNGTVEFMGTNGAKKNYSSLEAFEKKFNSHFNKKPAYKEVVK